MGKDWQALSLVGDNLLASASVFGKSRDRLCASRLKAILVVADSHLGRG